LKTPRVGACACEATGRTNLVAKNQERHIDKLVAGHQTVKLGLGFLEARTLERVHEEHDAVDGAEIVLPELPRTLVSSEIVSFEANVSNDELVLVRVDGGAVDLDARFLEHM